MKKKLSIVQKKFITAYIDTLNPIKSAIDAGYCEKNAASAAQNILDNDSVINEINSILSSQTKTLNISKAYIVKKLVDIIENSLNTIEPDCINEVDSHGRTLSGKNAKKQKDVAVALKALENLCKQLNFSPAGSRFDERDDSFDEIESPKINIINNLDENKL